MKITVKEFTVEAIEQDDISQLRQMLDGPKAFAALNDMRENLFSPSYKHGYSDEAIRKHFNDDLPEAEYDARFELISALEDKFREVLSDNGIVLDD